MAHITDIFLSGLAGALLVGIVVPITIKIWNMMLRYRDKQKIRKYFTDTIKNEVSRKLKANNLRVSHEDFHLIEYQAASTLNIQPEYIRELLYEIKDFEIYDKASMPERTRAIKGEYIGMWKLKESYFKKRKLGDHSSEYNNYKLEHSDN